MATFDLANINELHRGVSKIFAKAFASPVKEYEDYTTTVQTKSHRVSYAFLAQLPQMQKWVGEREPKKLSDHKYTIEKEDYEATIRVMRDDFLTDNLGIVRPLVENMAGVVIEHYNQMINSLIVDNKVCYDNKKFFAVDHKIGKTTYKNITDAKLTEATLFAMMTAMQAIKGEEGKSLRIKPTLLLIAANLYRTAKQILGATVIDGTSNAALDLFKLKIIPEMSNDSWCLLDTSRALKPFILQITKIGKVEKSTVDLFKDKSVQFGVDTMDSVGYGYWQMAYFSTGDAPAPAPATATA